MGPGRCAHTHTHKESTRKGTRRTSFAAASKIYAHTHTHAQAPTVVAPHPTPRAPRARHSPPHPPHHPFLHAMSSSSSTGHLRAARPTGAVAPTARAPRRRPLPVLHRAPTVALPSRVVNSSSRLLICPQPFAFTTFHPAFFSQHFRFSALPIVKTYHVIRFTAHTPVRGTPHPGTRQAPAAFPPTFHRTSTPLSRRHTTPLVRRSTRHHTVTCIRTGEGRPHHAGIATQTPSQKPSCPPPSRASPAPPAAAGAPPSEPRASQASDGRSHVQATQPRSPDDQTYR